MDLKYPFKSSITGDEIKAVNLRNEGRVKVGDMMAVAAHMERDKMPPSTENVYLVARMCGLDVKEIEGMDAQDFTAIVHEIFKGKPEAS